MTPDRKIAIALGGLGVAVAAAVIVSVARRSHTDRGAGGDGAAVGAPATVAKAPVFAETPPLPAAEPPCDRALVARVQALAEAKPEDAVPVLQSIVKTTDDPAALTIASTVARRLAPADAEAVYTSIIAKGNALPHAYRGLAETYVRQGRVEPALRVYAEGLEKHPTEFALREAYARYLAGQGRAVDAADVCLKDIEEGNDTRANSQRRCILAGEILFAAGRKDQARAAWEKILAIAENEQEGQRYVGQLLALHNMVR
jgi:tetratricopeptide (TPR) repeat protein